MTDAVVWATCSICLRRASAEGMTRCVDCGMSHHVDCGVCACREFEADVNTAHSLQTQTGAPRSAFTGGAPHPGTWDFTELLDVPEEDLL